MMTFSVFKSTSKSGTTLPSSVSEAKKSNRSSKNVSPLSRTNGSTLDLSLPDDLFMNKIDNPLYCCSSSPSSSSSTDRKNAKIEKKDILNEDAASGRAIRGRSASRSSGIESQSNERRLRSVSRGHYGNSESDLEHQYKSTSNTQNKGDDRSATSKAPKNSKVSDEEFGDNDQTKNLKTWTSRHPIIEFSDASSSFCQDRSWEDGSSSSSLSEVEDVKIIMRDFHQTDGDSDSAVFQTIGSELCMEGPSLHSTENIIDIPPEFLDPDELYCDEYVWKLEQAKERARKLRTDLAIEEEREQELSRIVENIIHAPTVSKPRKSRMKRREIVEKTKMSRQLGEEALNYFDECVSISTFESSDFSSFEDQQLNSAVGINRISLAEGSDSPLDENTKLSYAHNHDIKQFIKKFEKGSRKESFEHPSMKSSYNSDEYDLNAKSESLALDAFIVRNRVEYGGLFLCNSGFFS